jgi:hypothetical protein
VILGHLCTARVASLMIVATPNTSQKDPKISSTTVVVRLAPQ